MPPRIVIGIDRYGMQTFCGRRGPARIRGWFCQCPDQCGVCPQSFFFELNNHYSNGLFSIFAVSGHTVLPFFGFEILFPVLAVLTHTVLFFF